MTMLRKYVEEPVDERGVVHGGGGVCPRGLCSEGALVRGLQAPCACAYNK